MCLDSARDPEHVSPATDEYHLQDGSLLSKDLIDLDTVGGSKLEDSDVKKENGDGEYRWGPCSIRWFDFVV